MAKESILRRFLDMDPDVIEFIEELPQETTSLRRSDFPLHVIKKDGNEVIFTATYENRKLKINGIIISKPNFDSENDVFADYIFKHPNEKITARDFENHKKNKMHKKFDVIIRDLGFYGNLKKLFFPNISIKAVEFRNPISRNDMKKAGIDDISPLDFQNKK